MRPFSPPSCLLAPWLQFEERESHRVTGPSEQLWPNFVFAQLCRAESSQTPALLARDSLPGFWATGAVGAVLVTPKPLFLRVCWYQGWSGRRHLELWEERKTFPTGDVREGGSPGHPLFLCLELGLDINLQGQQCLYRA